MTQQLEPTVLVVEDDPDLRELIAETLETDGFTITQASDAAAALMHLRVFAFDAVVIDLRLPDADGMRVLDMALDCYPQIVSVVVSGFGGVTEAVAAMKRGAHDFLIKPFALPQLSKVLQTGLGQRQHRQENAEIRAQLEDRFHFEGIIGHSQPMEKLFSTLSLVAPLNTTVLLQGETGTGKELVARTIHENSGRSGQRFVAFNAAAIPEALAEAELFGHSKGAFTGAVSSRIGRFELAHRGTLFIDEVALMPLALQSKLLRALQEREIERVGESRPIKFDARVVAATSADLPALVKDGTFREDLFYRLNVVRITLPPLRNRADDTPILARHFVEKACQRNSLPKRTLGQDALRALMGYDWPGNVRELENAMEHAVALSGTELEIQPALLPPEVVEAKEALMLPSMAIPEDGINLNAVLSKIEHELIKRCLERTGGNKRQAARLLHLSRTTLIDKLNRLSQPKRRAAADDDAADVGAPPAA